MFMGFRLPAAVAAWKPHRVRDIRRSPSSSVRSTERPFGPLPHGVAAAEDATRSALAAVSGLARERRVGLQMAFEPDLLVQSEPGIVQFCLRDLCAAAIERAGSAILVTGRRQAGMVEIAVLDDGCLPGAGPAEATALPLEAAPELPPRATLTASYRPDGGTTMLLRLPCAGQADCVDRLPTPACAIK